MPFTDFLPFINFAGVLSVALIAYIQARKGSSDSLVSKFIELQEKRLDGVSTRVESLATELELKRVENLQLRQDKHDLRNEMHQKEIHYELELQSLRDCIGQLRRALRILASKVTELGGTVPEFDFTIPGEDSKEASG
jgi:predicted RNase H-like nuclease (RuvC/YqgF family)